MSRPIKITLRLLGGLLAFLVVIAIVGVYIAQSDWLRERLRGTIVSQLQKATGGQAEIGKFKFDWKTLTAELDGVVLHGTEPKNGPPLLRIKTLVVGLKIISLAKQDFDIAFLRVEEPKAYLLVAADGSTNVPEPKGLQPKSKNSPIESLLNLKVGELALNHGEVAVHAAGQAPKTTGYDAMGSNLQLNLGFELAGLDYKGNIKLAPLQLRYGTNTNTAVNVDVAFAVAKNSLQISSGKFDTAESHLDLSGSLTNYTNPVVTAQYSGKISVKEAGSILKLKSRQSGTVELAGNARYASATDYLVTGKIHGRDIAFTQPGLTLRNIRLDTGIESDPKRVKLDAVRVALLGGVLAGEAEIEGFDNIQAKGKLEHFDVSTLAALATKQKLPYDGAVSGPFDIRGRLSDSRNQHLTASARLGIAPVAGQMPVQGLLDAKYVGAGDVITIAPSYVALPNTRLDLSGVLGDTLHVRIESHNLNDLLPALAMGGTKSIPVSLGSAKSAGSVIFDGTVVGKLATPQIAGHVAGRNFVYQDQTIDLLDADLNAQNTGATVARGMLAYKMLRASFSGSVGLRNWQAENFEPLTASVNAQNANVADLLILAGQKGIPVSGVLNTNAQITGTVGNPQATADLTVANGSLYQEPFDRLTGKLNYANGGTQAGTFQLRAGTKQVDLKATYTHAATDFLTGKLQFDVASNRMQLSQFANVRKQQPGVNGVVELKAQGNLAVSQIKGPKNTTATKVDIGILNANLNATAISLDGRSLGDASLTTTTQGQTLKAHAESNLAQSNIRGDATVQLQGDYLTQANVTFVKADIGTLRRLFLPLQPGQTMQFGGTIEGKLDLTGPASKPLLMTGRLEIPSLAIRPDPLPASVKQLGDITIRATEPIRVSLANQIIRVDSAKFTAKNTNLAIQGNVRLADKEQPLNLRAVGTGDLSLAQVFDKDLSSSGTVTLNVGVAGKFDQPQITGRADLKDVNLAYAGLPNGISNGNGRILFDGSRATIESLTAQTGGGTLKLAGFAAFAGPQLAFRLEADANGVRIRYPEGVSSVSDAALTLTGTSDRSVLAGDITIQKIAYNPRSDLGSILSATTPVTTSEAPTGVLAGVRFDVRIQTSPDITFQTGLAQDSGNRSESATPGQLRQPRAPRPHPHHARQPDLLQQQVRHQPGHHQLLQPRQRSNPSSTSISKRKHAASTVTLTVSGPCHETQRLVPQRPALAVRRYCRPPCNGENAERSHSGGAPDRYTTELAAAGRHRACRPGDRKPGRGPLAAFLRS